MDSLLDAAKRVVSLYFSANPMQNIPSHVCNAEDECDQGCIESGYIRMEMLALREAINENEWHPISTAPETGETKILWWPYWTKRPVAGYFHNGWKSYSDRVLADWCTDDPGPTHWKPFLPEEGPK